MFVSGQAAPPIVERDVDDGFRALAVDSALSAGRALTGWLGHEVDLHPESFHRVKLCDLAGVAGEAEDAVVAVHMPLSGDLRGDVLLSLSESSARRLADLLLGRAPGETTSLDELEMSCLQETGNIVASSFANCMSRWLRMSVIPGSPQLAYDLASAVVQPLFLDEATRHDEVWLTRTRFHLGGEALDWRMVLMLTDQSLHLLTTHFQREQVAHYELDQFLLYSSGSATKEARAALGRMCDFAAMPASRGVWSDLTQRGQPDELVRTMEMELPDDTRLVLIITDEERQRFERLAGAGATLPGGTPLLDYLLTGFLRDTHSNLAARLESPTHAISTALRERSGRPAEAVGAELAQPTTATHELFRADLLVLLLSSAAFAKLGNFDV
jgi:chemotaxis protein CheC